MALLTPDPAHPAPTAAVDPPAARWLGPLFMLASVLAFTGQITTVKFIATEMHPFEIGFFRQLFGFLVLLPIALRAGAAALKPRRFGLYLARSVMEITSMMLMFVALWVTTLTKVTALFFTTPLFATLFAALLLGERLRVNRLLGLALGLAGALFILRPGAIAIDAGGLAALGAAALWGAAMMAIKVLSRTETPLKLTFFMGVLAVPLSLVTALPVWEWPTVEQLGWLALTGTFGTIAHLTLVRAFQAADVTAVLPIDYTRLIWAALLGYAIFDEVPEAATWIGGTVIFAAVLGMTLADRRRAAAAAKPPLKA